MKKRIFLIVVIVFLFGIWYNNNFVNFTEIKYIDAEGNKNINFVTKENAKIQIGYLSKDSFPYIYGIKSYQDVLDTYIDFVPHHKKNYKIKKWSVNLMRNNQVIPFKRIDYNDTGIAGNSTNILTEDELLKKLGSGKWFTVHYIYEELDSSYLDLTFVYDIDYDIDGKRGSFKGEKVLKRTERNYKLSLSD